MITLTAKSQANATNSTAWHAHFCALPERVRTGNARTGLIPGALWGEFLKQAQPQHTEFWIAYEGSTPVGRIGANLTPTGTGVVGFFEVDVAHPAAAMAARMLLDTAAKWLIERNMISVVGPMNFNTWFAYRLRTDDDSRAFAWEPQNPPQYVEYFEKAGFRPLETYHSIGTAGLKAFHDASLPSLERAKAAGYTFRGWDGANILEKEVPILHRLSNEGFKGNFLFQPLPLEMFRQLYVPIANKFDFSYCFFAVNPQGEETGFTFAFAESEALVMKSVTVIEAERGKGLSNALMNLASAEALKRNITNYVSALMREGNRSESYSRKGETLWTHRYVLYERRSSSSHQS